MLEFDLGSFVCLLKNNWDTSSSKIDDFLMHEHDYFYLMGSNFESW